MPLRGRILGGKGCFWHFPSNDFLENFCSFHLICIKALLRCFYFHFIFNSLMVIRGHYEVKHVFSSYIYVV